MKNPFLKAFLCSICFYSLFIGKADAQYMVNGKEVDTTFNSAMNHIFGTLDATRIPYGLLRDYAIEFRNLENFNGTALVDSNKIDQGVFRQIYTTLATARMTASAYATLPNPGIIDSLWFNARGPAQVTLSGLFYQYSYLDPNAANNGEITITNGQLFDKFVSGVWQNPYLQGYVVGFAPAGDSFQGTAFNIMLPANLWLTNSVSLVSSIQVDAGDGLGYRTLTPGVNFPVSYADTGMKAVNFKVFLTNSSILQSHTQLHVVQDPLVLYGGGPNEGQPVTSHGLTTTQYNNIYTAASTATYNGVSSYATITVQYIPGHTTLTNPLIVVEGFDPGIYTKPESPTGESSIGSFITSIVNSRSDPLKMLLSDPANAQYDIVYIDFRNGTDDIHRNALVVEDVIRWVNANKTGTNKITVLGQSMGCLCARYALKSMEKGGETHNVGLFISQGAPERGASVPLGIQYLENHLDMLYLQTGPARSLLQTIKVFINPLSVLGGNTGPDVAGVLTLTNTPAAKQMLVNRINSKLQLDNNTHISWQTELDSLKYPTQGNIRNIAISAGSECGQTQTIAQGGQLFLVNGQLQTSFLGDLLAAFAFPVAGRLLGQPALMWGGVPGRNQILLYFAGNTAVDGGGNQAYTGKIVFKKTILWVIPVYITMTNRSINTPSGLLSYETYAGDYYDVNSVLSSTTKNATVLSGLAAYGITLNVAPSFGFIPTPSALDIGHGTANLLESDYLLPYSEGSPPALPKNTPFANFITAFTPLSTTNVNNNEAHLIFETRNGNWLAKELTANPIIADCTNLCQVNSISGDLYDCNEVKTYAVPYYSNVTYNWTKSNNLQTIGATNLYYVQVQPLSGSNGQPGSVTVSMTLNNNNNGDCGTQIVTKTINIGVEPLVVNSTVDRTPQSSHYQYLTATATQLPGTTSSNYTWWLTNSTGQVQYQIGSGLVLSHYPIAPSSTIFYQCQAVTPCGTAIYNGYAYNSYYGSNAMTQAVVIFPNPASTTMTVTNNSIPATTDVSGNPNGNTPQSYQIVVYNDKGKVMKSAANQHGSPDVTFATDDMPDGNYFLHIIQGSSIIEKQVMVRH